MMQRDLVLCCLSYLALLMAGRVQARCPNKQDRVVSFNTGLTPFVDNFQNRRTKLSGAILRSNKAIKLDFLCFQEMWYEEDIERVKSAIKDTYPFHFSPIHAGISRLTSPADRKSGSSLPSAMCMLEFCLKEGYGLPDVCRKCLIISGTSTDSILDLCTNATRPDNKFNRFNPSGLFIASQYPLKASYTPFLNSTFPTMVERGYITVQVKDMPLYVCTHLTADMSPFPYIEAALPYTSYQEQNKAELEALHATFSTSPHVIMGDLNTGPETSKLKGHMPDNYAYLESVGYSDPYLIRSGRCTYCEKNTNAAIDHILTMDVKSDQQRAKRVFDRYAVGKLSDHYGVRLDICRPNSSPPMP